MFLGVGGCRSHHRSVHDLGLVDVPVEEWECYGREHRAQIQNPAGLSSRERNTDGRHPAYRVTDE